MSLSEKEKFNYSSFRKEVVVSILKGTNGGTKRTLVYKGKRYLTGDKREVFELVRGALTQRQQLGGRLPYGY